MNPPSGCPMHQPATEPEKKEPPQGCPMHVPQTPPPSCPMHKEGPSDELNKLNMIPNLTDQRQDDQQIDLPTERVISSIPKAKDDSAKWEYPSPQQFYNALRRKGWETPEEHIETMVDIHNFLNEEAWNEVLKWESKFSCECQEDPYLARFQGRPQDISPKARWHTMFGAPKPFDRHDWFVGRCGKERRYVIDYYEAPEETPGVPVYHLDVRPALDNSETIFCRMKEAAAEKFAQWFSPSSSTN